VEKVAAIIAGIADGKVYVTVEPSNWVKAQGRRREDRGKKNIRTHGKPWQEIDAYRYSLALTPLLDRIKVQDAPVPLMHLAAHTLGTPLGPYSITVTSKKGYITAHLEQTVEGTVVVTQWQGRSSLWRTALSACKRLIDRSRD
jgi:hypothetical protein